MMMNLNVPLETQTTLIFDPIEHKYTNSNGAVYTSVTTLIDKYDEPFNKKYWSMYTALRDTGYSVRPDQDLKGITVNGVFNTIDSLYNNPVNNVKVREIIEKWTKINKTSTDRGNQIHDFLEDSINESKDDKDAISNGFIKPIHSLEGELAVFKTIHDLDSTEIKVRYPAIYKRLKHFIDLGCIIYAEKKIYSTSYHIAGTIDVLIVKGKQFAIMDWKTNKDEMMFTAGYYKKEKIGSEYVKTDNYIRTFKKLKAPLNTLEKCKGIKYSLQLSLYAYIMIRWGYKLVENGLEIWHLRPGLEPRSLKIKYYGNEIQSMVDHHYFHNVINNSKKLYNLAIK